MSARARAMERDSQLGSMVHVEEGGGNPERFSVSASRPSI